jgi:DNA-binding protein YbaB
MADNNQPADDNEILKELEKSLASGDSSALMKELEQNMQDMKQNLEQTFKGLDDETFTGESSDKSFKIEMTGTYNLKDIDFGKAALQGGVTEFKWRIREAWKSVMEQIQEATQKKTMDLLGGMNLPPELQGFAEQQQEKDDEEG